MEIMEAKKDLFEMDKSYALAHCISEDCAMGAGIAVQFNKQFRNMRCKLLEKHPKTGQAVVYYSGGRPIFNLITKKKYWHKPTYDSFSAAIRDLKKQMVLLDIKKLAIPQIGAGLDRLSWARNKQIISEIFSDTDIEIVVCKLK